MKVILILSLLIKTLNSVLTPDISYCNPYFKYVEYNDGYIAGLLELEKEPGLLEYKIDVNMSIDKYSPGASKQSSLTWLICDDILILELKFPFQDPIANIISILLNNKLICQKPYSENATGTAISLSKKLNYPSVKSNPKKDRNPIHEGKPSPPCFKNSPIINDYKEIKATPYKIENKLKPLATTEVYYQKITNNIFENFSHLYDNISTKNGESNFYNSNARKTTVFPSLNFSTIKPPTEISIQHFPLPSLQQNDMQETLENICGKASISKYLVNGKPTNQGEFPWLSIIYRHQGQANLLFHCTGSLISQRHIITAGHCIKTHEITYKPEDFLSVLGKYNILKWTKTNSYISEINAVFLHPNYKIIANGTLYADIGVLLMNGKVEFTPFIKPICLWNKSTKLSDVIGRKGTIAGWNNGDKDLLDEPLKVEFPIVSNEECLKDNPGFFYLINNTTFCAGDKSGTGPCLGDSGAGFYVEEQNQWYLRGIVSLAFAGEFSACDLFTYFVFVDIAQVLPWLKSIIFS